MSEHLTQAQIERYVSRRAAVDELLASATHLETCWDCRDRAAAMVDSGAGELSHVRPKKRISGARAAVPEPSARTFLPWIFGALIVIAIVAWLLVGR